jgi:hypothetical protein
MQDADKKWEVKNGTNRLELSAQVGRTLSELDGLKNVKIRDDGMVFELLFLPPIFLPVWWPMVHPSSAVQLGAKSHRWG